MSDIYILLCKICDFILFSNIYIRGISLIFSTRTTVEWQKFIAFIDRQEHVYLYTYLFIVGYKRLYLFIFCIVFCILLLKSAF